MSSSKNTALVSIITPAYNEADYIGVVIDSVLEQTHPHWELLIVDNGSSDGTASIVQSYDDERIRLFQLDTNKGVSHARNVGLAAMQGNYFCFLDGDDYMPPKSLEIRLHVFDTNPEVCFVDGKVLFKNKTLSETLNTYQPRFRGYPLPELIALSNSCYFGNTWMVKREAGINYQFDETMTHAEDLLFYMSIASNRLYDYTNEEVLHYRITGTSAMSNIELLEESYFKLYRMLKAQHLFPNEEGQHTFKSKIKRILYRSYLKQWKLGKALRVMKRHE